MEPVQDLDTSGKKAVLVIVDDEQSILKELRILLARMYTVHVFTNPEEAEVFVDNNEVDLVISDEMMPEMRGSELLSRINAKHPDICNIVLSGQAEKDDIVRVVNEGHIFSFLYKPTERQQLLNVIERGLENRQMKIKLAKQNEQLREYSENLERMVEEKTTQLVKAYDRLNMLDAGKMNFLVYLSGEMDSSLDRIHKLAQELLTYFAFAGTELQVTPGQVNLADVITKVAQDSKARCDEAGVSLEVRLDKAISVMAEPIHLEKVIGILVDNALAFSKSGGEITVSGEVEGQKVRFFVADKGRGIARENLEKIFTPFVINREDRRPDGFGLNLPVAKSILQALDGTIWAESEGPGSGARFCVELKSAVE